MKALKVLSSLLFTALMVAFFAPPIAQALEISTLSVAAGIVSIPIGYSLVKNFMPSIKTQGLAFMAVQQEFWVDYIIANRFKNQQFLQYCFDESDKVLNGSVVHIPQAGSKPTIVKNRNGQATAVIRTDSDVLYALDTYTSDPTVIQKADQMEISYNKMDSVIGEHMQAMSETIGDSMLYRWAPTDAANIIRTSGAVVPAHLDNATGNRLAMARKDLKAAKTRMNKQNISTEDRYALFDDDMLDQMTEDTTLLQRDGVNGGELDMKNGVILKLEGFNIMRRSEVLRYTNAGTPVPKDPDAADAATDNAAVLCWQRNAVAKALGTTDFFERLKDPEWYGDLYSILQKGGGRKRRADGCGVIAIVQSPSS